MLDSSQNNWKDIPSDMMSQKLRGISIYVIFINEWHE
jgi:hypothetical protein